MQRSTDYRRAQWIKHNRQWANRIKWGGKHMYKFAPDFPVYRGKYIARRAWERLEQYNRVDYDRRQTKAETLRAIKERD